jgi:hypothetical protein
MNVEFSNESAAEKTFQMTTAARIATVAASTRFDVVLIHVRSRAIGVC